MRQTSRQFMDMLRANDEAHQMADEIRSLRKVIRTILDEWWDKIYPEDVFVGGPNADSGVKDVVRLRDLMRSVLPKRATAKQPKTIVCTYCGKRLPLSNTIHTLFDCAEYLKSQLEEAWNALGNVQIGVELAIANLRESNLKDLACNLSIVSLQVKHALLAAEEG